MKKLSIFRMLVIVSLGFALSFSSNVQGPLQQYKTRELAPDMPNTALGALGFVGLMVAMVVQPIVGVFSDRAKSRLGRRLPFFIGGAVLIALSLLLMAWAPALWVLMAAMILTQFSSNILQGPWHALIPDQVPEAQRGTASSLKAVLDILAFMIGGGVGGFLMGQTSTWGQVAVYITALSPTVLFAIFVVLTAIWAREDPNAQHEVPTTTVAESLKKAFYVNWKEHPVFGNWFANRILFWGAYIAVTTFLTNFFIDVIGMKGDEARAFTGQLQIILGVGLILLALAAGWLSDRFGRKPVMLAAGFIATAGTLMLLLVRDKGLIIVAGVLIGMGIGMFLSASWALATDIVPREEAARYLGIANVATCIGSGVARLLGGVLIDPINIALGSSSSGYLLLFALAMVAFLASSLVILRLPGKKRASG